MCADIPPGVQSFLSSIEAFAVPKGDNDIRPLGKINLDRKVAAICVLQSNNPTIRSNFKDVQFGCDHHGTERIIHSVRFLTQKRLLTIPVESMVYMKL